MDLNGFDCILQDRLICLRQWQHRQDLFSSIGERMRWVPLWGILKKFSGLYCSKSQW